MLNIPMRPSMVKCVLPKPNLLKNKKGFWAKIFRDDRETYNAHCYSHGKTKLRVKLLKKISLKSHILKKWHDGEYTDVTWLSVSVAERVDIW